MTDEVDADVRAALTRDDRAGATELALRTYGPELIGWLASSLSNEADAFDAFSLLSEELWRSLERFDGRCSVRTWCYMLARQAASRVRRQPRRAHEWLVTSVPSVAHAVTELWSTTRVDAQHEQDVYAQIRRELPEDEQTLLVLRVDRDLSWQDIALVMLGEQATEDDVTRKASALRKQFERLKERLRVIAAERLSD